MASYIPNTKKQQQAMLDAIGVSSINALFSDIPQKVRLKESMNIPKGVSELETARIMQNYADQNVVFKTILRGAGAYNHYIPAAVSHIATREEFVTVATITFP